VLALLVIAAFVLVALNAGTSSSSPTRSVVVASKDLPPRLPIDAGSLSVVALPVPSDYPQVFFNLITDVQGMVPLVTIPAGQAITANEVAKPSQALGSQSAYLPIPTGYVALTIPTSEQQGVAGYIQPNDYISVIATVATSGKVATKTIFTNVRVIGLGPATANVQPAGGATSVGGSGPVGGVTSSLTIELTQCDAEYFTWFLGNTTLRYTLESFHDYLQQPPSAPDPTCPTVLSAQGVSQKEVEARYHFTAL